MKLARFEADGGPKPDLVEGEGVVDLVDGGMGYPTMLALIADTGWRARGRDVEGGRRHALAKPQRFLQPPDVVRCEIDGIGAIENRVPG